MRVGDQPGERRLLRLNELLLDDYSKRRKTMTVRPRNSLPADHWLRQGAVVSTVRGTRPTPPPSTKSSETTSPPESPNPPGSSGKNPAKPSGPELHRGQI